MTKAEKEMVKYLLTICGGDNCRKCVHCNKSTCCQYVSPTDYSGELNDDYCIDGMVKYFEQSEEMTKEKLKELFLHEIKISNEDICNRCAYLETAKCARGNQHLDENKELYWDSPEKFATEPCIKGMYEYFEADKK